MAHILFESLPGYRPVRTSIECRSFNKCIDLRKETSINYTKYRKVPDTSSHIQQYLYNLKTFFKKWFLFFKKFLQLTTCFGLYGHHHGLQLFRSGNCCASFRFFSFMQSRLCANALVFNMVYEYPRGYAKKIYGACKIEEKNYYFVINTE
jgi:hypothetical protein